MRQLKKREKKAAADLDRLHPGEYLISITERGSDDIDTPRELELPPGRKGRSMRYFVPLPYGFPLAWIRYEEDSSPRLPSDVLAELSFFDDPERAEEMLRELPCFDRALDEAVRSLWFVLQTDSRN